MLDIPRITFGMIVLNGQPFINYNLHALYPFAHQIIVVEGAAPGSAAIATKDGHSSDGTLEYLREFKQFHDVENKLHIITAEDEGYTDGFWPGEKDEQSQTYARLATGDFLWQIDVDEFYREADMHRICQILREDSNISAMSFEMITFWGGFDYIVDGYYLRRLSSIIHRLFKWGQGYKYVTHRPPTVIDDLGRDLRDVNWYNGHMMAELGVYLYHYSLVFPKQVREKSTYYQEADWAKREKAQQWADETFMQLKHPFRVHNVYNHLSWLEWAEVDHPIQIQNLMTSLDSGKENIEVRNTSDIENLLNSKWYPIGRGIVKAGEPFDHFLWGTLFRKLAILGSKLMGPKQWQKFRSRVLGAKA